MPGVHMHKGMQKSTFRETLPAKALSRLLNGGYKQPRAGRNNDKAHPPIHPVNYVAPSALGGDDRRVYEFVVRRFLACCSEDAKGELTTIEILYGVETFYTNGLLVLEKNYLNVYPYEKWESTQQLPDFTLNETFEPTEAKITDGETSAPGYLTEPELISLMDANGIGTDATMAEHIAKIKEREYVQTQPRGGGAGVANGRSGRGGRGRGRGGRTSSNAEDGGGRGRGGGNSVQQFIPTTLGVALIEGYDGMGLETSLGKPFLRKEMELQMKEVCAGTRNRSDFVQETLEQYREVFMKTQQQVETLKAVSFLTSDRSFDCHECFLICNIVLPQVYLRQLKLTLSDKVCCVGDYRNETYPEGHHDRLSLYSDLISLFEYKQDLSVSPGGLWVRRLCLSHRPTHVKSGLLSLLRITPALLFWLRHEPKSTLCQFLTKPSLRNNSYTRDS